MNFMKVPLPRMLERLGKGLHDALREAPSDWLLAMNHRRGVLFIGFWGALALCAAMPEKWMDWTCFEMDDECTIKRSVYWDVTHWIIGSLELCTAAMLSYVSVSPNLFQFILCLTHVVHLAGSTLTLGNEWQFVMYTGMTFPFFTLCLAMSGVCFAPFVTAAVINFAILLLRTWPMDWLHRPLWAAIICTLCSSVFVVVQHMRWRVIYITEQELLVEKEAVESLLSNFCDADCWTADDGDTVLRSDRRLDHMMGEPTEGNRLSKYLSAEDQQRLQQATTGTSTGALRALVRLLTVTVHSERGPPVNVECFIVDRRGVLSTKPTCSERRQLGFLIGFRLCSPDRGAACEPPDLEAGLNAELHLAQLAHWCAGGLSPVATEPGDGTPVGQAPPSTHSVPASSASVPRTLASAALPMPAMHVCSKADLVAALRGSGDCMGMGIPYVAGAEERETVITAVELVCEHAQGGALLCIGRAVDFKHVFPATGNVADAARPALRVCDKAYMTERLRGVHISDARFAAAFSEFTEHSADDRWPSDHCDAAARGQPKDGAFLISTSGYRLKCAVKLLGLPPPGHWDSVGTKHETAMACAWAVKGAHVLVRSDSGSIHYVVRSGDTLHVCKLARAA